MFFVDLQLILPVGADKYIVPLSGNARGFGGEYLRRGNGRYTVENAILGPNGVEGRHVQIASAPS